MFEIRYTLLSEGTSDRALISILNWLLRSHLPNHAIQATWADLSKLPKPPKPLAERIKTSVELYPCDVLFIHRDSDNQGIEQRLQEIDRAVDSLGEALGIGIIPVIPVRMMEAWLLFNEDAIRRAASKPGGRERLDLPSVRQAENIADPKQLLHAALSKASGCTGRRLKKFRPGEQVQRLAGLIEDFSALRQLSAFQRLDAQIRDLAGPLSLGQGSPSS